MAETAAIVSLIASIESLIDLAAQITARLQELVSKTVDVPEPFHTLWDRLPQLSSSLQLITQQIQEVHPSSNTVSALEGVIENASTRFAAINTCLSEAIPKTNAAGVQQVVKALQSQVKDGQIRLAMEGIHQDIDFLILHQTAQSSGTSDRILEACAKLPLASQPAGVQHGHTVKSVSAHDGSTVHIGDIYNINQSQELDELKTFGLCLGSAPLIEASNFIGRTAELDQMAHILQPGASAVEQRRLMLGGLGGIGKTQLAIAYARRYQASYTSIFWLNATTKSTLKGSIGAIAQQVLTKSVLDALDEKGTLPEVFRWLSDLRNVQWLLIFDNYDDPDLFLIGEYMPNASHGSIIVTTRLPDLVQGQQIPYIRLSPIRNVDESLEILQTRSQREDVKHDPGARRLTERLEGLPLALATAGAYLRKTTMTIEQYLHAYEQRFNINPRRPVQLQEYAHRTLYTTWDLTYRRLEGDDPLAARALKLFAYFDNQEISFDLLHAGLNETSPDWLREVAGEHITFENVMGSLVEYCLVEAQPNTRSYSIHSCVHDWTLSQLNQSVSGNLYWYSVLCIASSFDDDDNNEFRDSLEQLTYAPLSRHALRCIHPRFLATFNSDDAKLEFLDKIAKIARLMCQQVQLLAAELMYLRALAGYERVLGPDHTSTLVAVRGLGNTYLRQKKLDNAEQMYKRAVAGMEKALGPDHWLTLKSIGSLGVLYAEQGKLDKAEKLHQRALKGREKAFGPDHISTLTTINNLASVYYWQGKEDFAERIFQRALVGNEKTLGPNHLSTIRTVYNIGLLYLHQDRLEGAEQMLQRAFWGREKALGSNHTITLSSAYHLGQVYGLREKWREAEQMFKLVISRREKALGSNHADTLLAIHNLGALYIHQHKLDKAEQMYKRAMLERKEALGPNYSTTLETVHLLGIIYSNQNKLDDAEGMLKRALSGIENALEPDDNSIRDTAHLLCTGVSLSWQTSRS